MTGHNTTKTKSTKTQLLTTKEYITEQLHTPALIMFTPLFTYKSVKIRQAYTTVNSLQDMQQQL